MGVYGVCFFMYMIHYIIHRTRKEPTRPLTEHPIPSQFYQIPSPTYL